MNENELKFVTAFFFLSIFYSLVVVPLAIILYMSI